MSMSEISQPVGAMAWLLTLSFTSTGIESFEAAASAYDEIRHILFFIFIILFSTGKTLADQPTLC